MSGAIPPLPQYDFMEWCFVKKHRDNFTFTFNTIVLAIVHTAAYNISHHITIIWMSNDYT
jgi:hypothetical protein